MITKLHSDEHPYARRMRRINKVIDVTKLVVLVVTVGFIVYLIVR